MPLGKALIKWATGIAVVAVSYLAFALIYWNIFWVPEMSYAGRAFWVIITAIVAVGIAHDWEIE
jgi:hypothetical protein